MEEKDREILREAASEQGYTSIAINKDGKHVGGCFIPWKLTSSAINMKTPRVTLAVEDLQDEAIMADVKKCMRFYKGCSFCCDCDMGIE